MKTADVVFLGRGAAESADIVAPERNARQAGLLAGLDQYASAAEIGFLVAAPAAGVLLDAGEAGSNPGQGSLIVPLYPFIYGFGEQDRVQVVKFRHGTAGHAVEVGRGFMAVAAIHLEHMNPVIGKLGGLPAPPLCGRIIGKVDQAGLVAHPPADLAGGPVRFEHQAMVLFGFAEQGRCPVDERAGPQCQFEFGVLEFLQEPVGLRKVLSGVPFPALEARRLPVGIDGDHVDGDIFCVEAVDVLLEFILRDAPGGGLPETECPSRGQG